MGCYDTVRVPCPKCGAKSLFQSKGGDCALITYDLDEAPADVLSDANRRAPNMCAQCGTVFHVKVVLTAVATPVQYTGEDDDEW